MAEFRDIFTISNRLFLSGFSEYFSVFCPKNSFARLFITPGLEYFSYMGEVIAPSGCIGAGFGRQYRLRAL